MSSVGPPCCPTLHGGLQRAVLGRRATMAVLPEQPRLSAEQRRALKLIARIPRGATEATLFAHGFWSEMLAGLVLAGLAAVTSEMIKAGGPTMKVERYRITAAGRRASEGGSS